MEKDIARPECFIIMPIATPESWLSRYSDDREHFTHVLEHLFKPAVEKAGYTPVSPIAKGADLIHAEIIKNIEKADLVLCDMSTLNPNVFYEVGIRTAVNKPVCMVKDDKTQYVPFDTTILNHHQYCSALRPWNQGEETEKLAAHIQESAKRSGSQNSLWKFFGLSSRAALPEGRSSTDDRLQLLTLRIEGLSRQLTENRERTFGRIGTTMTRADLAKVAYQDMLKGFYILAVSKGVSVEAIDCPSTGVLRLVYYGEISDEGVHELGSYAEMHGMKLVLEKLARQSLMGKNISQLAED